MVGKFNTFCLLIFTSNCFALTVHVCYCSNNEKVKRVYRCSPFRFYFTCSSFYISFYILIRGRHKIKTTDGLYSIQHFSDLDPRKRNTNFSDIGSSDFSYALWYDICFYLKVIWAKTTFIKSVKTEQESFIFLDLFSFLESNWLHIIFIVFIRYFWPLELFHLIVF